LQPLRPHDVPSVSLEQLRRSVPLKPTQAPAEHFLPVTLRDWVPDSSQVLAKLPHADQLPYENAAQAVPSVLRMHCPSSVPVVRAHVPAWQVKVVTERARAGAVSSHVPA
jgi:hypothetical protein